MSSDSPIKKIGDICKVFSGGTPRRGIDGYYGGDVPWAKIGDIENAEGGYLFTTKESITQDGLKSINNKIFKKDTIFLALYGSVGKTAIAGREMSTNQAILGLIPKNPEVLYFKYLKYWLDYSKSELIGLARGVALQNISATIVKEYPIPLPTIEEQHRIVKILDLAQSLIEKRKQAISYLDDYIKAVFLDMFGDPVSNPKGWEKVKFEDICKIEKEQISPIKIKNSDYYIGLEDIEKETGRIIKTSSSNSALLKSTKFVFTNENVLYGKLRPYLNKVALPQREGICSTDILPLMPIKDKSQKHFICYLIRSDYFVSQMIKCTVGANLPRVNSRSLNETSVYSPPIALQSQFSEIVQNTESLKQKMQTQLRELQNNFQAQLQRSFRGGVEV
ncbi:MAG: restriction endonuclease subunit S [Ignavibacteria bacterium]|nr:restriction endonuclease subunit S [Ignavibacteria bacterium]